MIKRKKELVEYARRLKLASLAEHMTEIIHEAQEKQPTYSEFLLSCLAREAGERDRKSFLSRMKVAGLPARHTLDEYDFSRTEGLDGRQLQECLHIPSVLLPEVPEPERHSLHPDSSMRR